MKALSGAVFNTCAQLGGAVGMSVTQLIASSVTKGSSYPDKSSPEALMQGYRAAFWTMFAWMVFLCIVCLVGMRKVGKEDSMHASFSRLPARNATLESRRL